jgi:xanthine dehydrogenase accessory factor
MRAELASRAAELAAAGVAYVQATVVRVSAPASAAPGDAALVLETGRIEGFVGGGCAAGAVTEHALAGLRSGEPVLLRIRPDPGAAPAEPGAVTVVNPCLSGGALEIFLEPRRPAPRVAVVGDSPTARALRRLGEAMGYAVTPFGAGPGPVDPGPTAVVVASHGRDEEPALVAALRAGVPYVALVASRRRGAAVVAGLDVAEELRARVVTPAGLALGARTPEEIALAVLAQLVAVRRARPAGVGAPAPVPTAVDPMCGMTVVVAPDTLSAAGAYFCGEHCRRSYAGP